MDKFIFSFIDFVKPDKVSSDVYYIGFDKGGRDKVVHDVYTKLQYGG